MACVACLLAETPLAAMSRPAYPKAFMSHSASPRYYAEGRPQLAACTAGESIDDSLFSTVLLVVMLAVGGAFFIMAIAYFLGEDHSTVLHPPVADGAHALLWAVKQSTRGCATMC